MWVCLILNPPRVKGIDLWRYSNFDALDVPKSSKNEKQIYQTYTLPERG